MRDMPWTLNATCYYLLHYHERGRKRADANDSLAISLARKPNREHYSLFAERVSNTTALCDCRLIGFLVIICTNYHTSTSYTYTRPAAKYPERPYAILKRNLYTCFLGNYIPQRPLENCHDENHLNLKFS